MASKDSIPPLVIGKEEYCVKTSEEIGRGKFGTVYKGYRKSDHYAVAVKAVTRSDFHVDEETETLWQLYHPHIVTMLASVRRDGDVFIVMELCWTNLSELLKRTGPFDRHQLQQAVHHLFGGYKALADKHIIHCDIKPENVLVQLEPNGGTVLKLSDLGSSKSAGSEGPESGGDDLYMAPELGAVRMHTGEQVRCTESSDLWSLGLVINECSGGNKLGPRERSQLFLLAKEEKLDGALAEKIILSLVRTDIDSAAREIILGLLAPKVEKRLTVSKVFPMPYVRSKTADSAIRFNLTSLAAVRGCVPFESIVKRRPPKRRRPARRTGGVLHRVRNVMLCGMGGIGIDTVRENVANYYLSEFARIQVSGGESIPVEEIFVQLTLSRGSDDPLVGYESVIADFLKPTGQRNEHEKAMLLWGQPGFGKTTIVKKIAFDWATLVQCEDEEMTPMGDYADFLSSLDLLLVSPLRSYCGPACSKLTDVILQPPIVKKKEAKFIEKWLRSSENRSNVLVVLDGFDELSKPDVCAELNSILFDSTKLPTFPLLVTSRPHAVQHARLRSAQITGIAASEMDNIVHKYCPNGAELLKYIRNATSSKALESMFSCPLLLQLLCILFTKLRTLPKRQTDLYQEIFVWMIAKDREKRGLEERLVDLANEPFLKKLAHFAFKNTVADEPKLIFAEEEVKRFEVDVAEATRVGILVDGSLCSSADWPFRSTNQQRQFSFGHASFQEFLAASFAATHIPHFDIAVAKMTQKHRLSEQFLAFFVGLCENQAAARTVRNCLEEKFSFENSFERQVMLGREFDFDGLSYSWALFFDFVTLLLNESASTKIRVDALTPTLNRIRNETYGMPLLAFLYNPRRFVATQNAVCGAIYKSVKISKFFLTTSCHFCIAEFVYSKVDRALCIVHTEDIGCVESIDNLISDNDYFRYYGDVSAFRFRGTASALAAFGRHSNISTNNAQLFIEASALQERVEDVTISSFDGVQINGGGYLTLYLRDKDLSQSEVYELSRVLKIAELDVLSISCLWSKSPTSSDVQLDDEIDQYLWPPRSRVHRMCITNANFTYLKKSPSLRTLLRRLAPSELQLTSCEIKGDDFMQCGFPTQLELLDCIAVDVGSLLELARIVQWCEVRCLVVTLCVLTPARTVEALLELLNQAMTCPQLQLCDCVLLPDCAELIRVFPYRSSVWINGTRLR